MASNGYPQQGENAAPQNTTTSQSSGTTAQPPDQVGWYFVEQYYNTLGNTPDQISLFYNKRSSLVWGTEGDVLPMVQGRQEISEKIKSLNFTDCKVRVTNVDSQASANNGIIIQVMGQMIIGTGPCRRFAQTFFLAEQPNGYFVLNDIFRYLREEDECEETIEEEEAPPEVEEEAAVELEPEPVTVEEPVTEEPAKEAEETNIPAEVVPEPEQVKPEEPITIAPAVPEIPAAVPTITEITNGTPAEQETEQEKPVEEPQSVSETVEEAAPASPAPQVESAAATPAEPTPVPTPPPQPAQAEKPPAAAPTPTPAPVPAPVAAPAKPTTWASLLNSKPAPAAVPAPQPPSQPPATQPTQPAQTNAAATVTTPTSSSSGQQGWQSVSGDSRRHGRPTSIASSGDIQNQGYIKNVTEGVDHNALKDALAKFGTIKSFEVNKQRNSAIVEFDNAASLRSAKNASPLRIGDQPIYIDERRAPASKVGGPGGYGGPRSPAMGPRGDSRQNRGGGFQRVEGRFDNRDGRDGGRGGPRGGSGRGFPGRGRGGSNATN